MPILESIPAIALVLLLLALTLWAFRKKGIATFRLPAGRAATRRLELIEKLPLTPQHSLHLVRIAGRLLVVGVSPSGCQMWVASGEAALSDGTDPVMKELR